MKKKIDIDKFDFEAYIGEALKSHGFLFPENDVQMDIYERSMGTNPLPEELESPSFVFDSKKACQTPIIKINLSRDAQGERNWAIAAREGKDIPGDIWEQMKRDKEEAKKEQ